MSLSVNTTTTQRFVLRGQPLPFNPVLRLHVELAGMPGPLPSDDQLRDALRALANYATPMPNADEESDVVPPRPTLLERLDYFLDLGLDYRRADINGELSDDRRPTWRYARLARIIVAAAHEIERAAEVQRCSR